jgi:hypothetical protein
MGDKPNAVNGGEECETVSGMEDDFSMRLSVFMRAHGTNLNSRSSLVQPSLAQLLQHPVCVEVIKAELALIHSVENVMFYQHAVRYRKVVNDVLRAQLARHIHRTFIAEGSEQQINISTRHRDVIGATLSQKGGTHCPALLFAEAEREVLMLMETNVMKKLVHNTSYRLCQWLMTTIDLPLALATIVSHRHGQSDSNTADHRDNTKEMTTTATRYKDSSLAVEA